MLAQGSHWAAYVEMGMDSQVATPYAASSDLVVATAENQGVSDLTYVRMTVVETSLADTYLQASAPWATLLHHCQGIALLSRECRVWSGLQRTAQERQMPNRTLRTAFGDDQTLKTVLDWPIDHLRLLVLS